LSIGEEKFFEIISSERLQSLLNVCHAGIIRDRFEYWIGIHVSKVGAGKALFGYWKSNKRLL